MCISECIQNAPLAVFLGFTHIYVELHFIGDILQRNYTQWQAKVYNTMIRSSLTTTTTAELHRGMQCNTTQLQRTVAFYDDDDEVDDGAW